MIDLANTMEEIGISDVNPTLTYEERQARVRDLLMSRSGIYHPAAAESPEMKYGRPKQGSHRPGTFWYYNNWDFNALGTIFESFVKTSIFSAFNREIADPLKMEDFRLEDTKYFRDAASVHPAYMFRMTARDIARFGLLFLRQGEWRGKQIIPRNWISESTRAHSDAGDRGGYGYMWWAAKQGKLFPFVDLGEGAYAAIGYDGHYLVVIPHLNLIVMHQADAVTYGRSINDNQFGRLLKLIIEAKML